MPEVWSLAALRGATLGRIALWVTPSVADVVRAQLPRAEAESLEDADTLIVVGGGTLIDDAKLRARQHHKLRLIAIPSIWGSGAEASPIAIAHEDGRKVVHIDDTLMPDVRVLWPELGETVPTERARIACGDVWAHALEGFLSPLAKPELRHELVSVITTMLDLPIGFHPDWFDLSARACAGQSRSSVGLVHGIAHVLERRDGLRWTHAGLCATWLLPVMELNRTQSGRLQELFDEYDLSWEAIRAKLSELYDQHALDEQRPALAEAWRNVLRDPSTRTNVVLVRPAHLQFLEEFNVGSPRTSTIQ